VTGSSEPPVGLRPDDWSLDPRLSGAGLNLAGVLTSARYDELVPAGWRCSHLLPSARSVAVLGSGGSAFFEAAMTRAKENETVDGRADPHPLDSHCESHVREAADRLARAGWKTIPLFYWEKRVGNAEGASPGRFADFMRLAQEAGLGSPSRLGLLIHPEYGPWLGIRALLVTERELTPPPGDRLESTRLPFEPCGGCPAPCIGACHAGAVRGGESSGGEVPLFSHPDCARARDDIPACRERCDARLACPVGRPHAYSSSALAHHMLAPFRSSLDR
jgi:epoxyqueuosine reductase QueG